VFFVFFFQAEDGIRDRNVTGVQTCALPISRTFFARSWPITYWSRTFLISAGLGSERISRLFSSSHSSAMISLQSSMHSSQMYTVGPAISLRTSFWLFPQNEHFRVPLPSRVRAFSPLLLPPRRQCRGLGHRPGRRLGRDDVVDDSIFLRLLRGHEKVPVRIPLDFLHGLAGVVDEDPVQLLAHPEDLPRLDVD